ncbi:hypothetical protein [Acinetobacter sp.]|uniref:hypothetical protein n=1 Tax=Acinetobacter sp. TaxID=472 RepID=UPI0038902E6D
MRIYLCGGAVRDELLGLTPKDFDYVVVGATPQDMIEQGFEQVGADFPVFLHPKTKDEYALARTERKSGTGYHGFVVDFDPNITVEDDLWRRDLTINAMAKSADATIIDPFGGQGDLTTKTLRHVSPAFAEDPLRVIRLARFYARYSDFSMATTTIALAQEIVTAGELDHLPNERFWAELEKVMGEKRPDRFFMALLTFGADKQVRFFRELYGALDVQCIAKMMQVSDIVTQQIEAPADRLMFHTAMFALHASRTIKTAPSRTQKLYENIETVRQMGPATVDGVFEILKRAKAWSQGTEMDDLIKAVEMLAASDEPLYVSAGMLRAAVTETKKVMAEEFAPKFGGKALGEAIEKGRKSKIASILAIK